MTVERKKNFLINILFLAVVFTLVYFCFKFLTVFLLPFLIGLIISVVSQKPVDAISKKLKLNRNFVSVAFVVVVYFLVIALISVACYGIYSPLRQLIDHSSDYIAPISEFFGNLNTKIADILNKETYDFSEYISISDLLKNISGKLADVLGVIVSAAPTFLISIIVTVVASCYIAKDYTKILDFFKKNMPQSWVSGIRIARDELFNHIFKILWGYVIIMFITFCELSLGLGLLGVKHFFAVAAIIAVVDILPVLGVGTVLIPWALFLLITGKTVDALLIALLYVVIAVVRNFLEPRIIGKQIGLHPLMTLICMFVGLKVFGIIGMFALPLGMMILVNLQESGRIDVIALLKKSFL